MSASTTRHAFSFLRRYSRAYRRPLVQGLAGTLGVVFFRLAIPWPLRGVVEFAFPHGSHRGATVLSLLPSWGDPLLWLCVAYFVCALGSGVTEMVQRTGMVGFVSRTVDAIRSAALRSAVLGVGNARFSTSELVSRLVADVGRLRTDLTGILVHVSKDALLFLAVAAMFLLWISPAMGAFFVVGGALACWVGYLASRRVVTVARRARQHEGAFAATIQKTLERGHLVPVSTPPGISDDAHRHEAHSTRIVTVASIAVHGLLGITVGSAVWVGVHEIRAGVLAPGELFLFMAYALMVHRRLVDAGRQLARIGKVRATIERLEPLVESPSAAVGTTKRPLRSGVRLQALRVEALRGRRPRLEDLDVELTAGTRVAVIGRSGDGKSTLLRCLAGAEPAATGIVEWDGEVVRPIDPILRSNVGYLPQDPVFAPAPIWRFLGLSSSEAPDEATITLLRGAGAWKLIERLPKGLRQKVGSATLSRDEARALSLAAILLGDAPLLALDSPFEGVRKSGATVRLETALAAAEGRTLVVALPYLKAADSFDRIIVLRRGRVDFDGTPSEWRTWKAATGQKEVEACRA